MDRCAWRSVRTTGPIRVRPALLYKMKKNSQIWSIYEFRIDVMLSKCGVRVSFTRKVHVRSADLQSLFLEERSQRIESDKRCKDQTGEQKPRNSQHRSRTTFTQEQSKVLEQGALKKTKQENKQTTNTWLDCTPPSPSPKR